MIINVEKTKTMVISTKREQTRSIDNLNFNLFMNNLKSALVTEQKPLGILVTNTLNWKNMLTMYYCFKKTEIIHGS